MNALMLLASYEDIRHVFNCSLASALYTVNNGTEML